MEIDSDGVEEVLGEAVFLVEKFTAKRFLMLVFPTPELPMMTTLIKASLCYRSTRYPKGIACAD